jgi:hypothetical protein
MNLKKKEKKKKKLMARLENVLIRQAFIIQNLDVVALELDMKVQFASF